MLLRCCTHSCNAHAHCHCFSKTFAANFLLEACIAIHIVLFCGDFLFPLVPTVAPEPVSVGTSDSGEGGGGVSEEEDEEEVDFGYWEKAELPTTAETVPETSREPPDQVGSTGKGTPLPTPPSRDMDLSLL